MLDFWAIPPDTNEVKVDAAKKEKSEAELLDQETGNLLKAIFILGYERSA